VFSDSIYPCCNDYFQWGYNFFHKRTLGAAQTWGKLSRTCTLCGAPCHGEDNETTNNAGFRVPIAHDSAILLAPYHRRAAAATAEEAIAPVLERDTSAVTSL